MGYNCAQSVACAFADKVDLDKVALFKVTEGLGLGMGGMNGTCGAISAAAVLAGLKDSTGDLELANSKAVSYKDARECIARFLEKNQSVVCRDLKGVETGNALRLSGPHQRMRWRLSEKHCSNISPLNWSRLKLRAVPATRGQLILLLFMHTCSVTEFCMWLRI